MPTQWCRDDTTPAVLLNLLESLIMCVVGGRALRKMVYLLRQRTRKWVFENCKHCIWKGLALCLVLSALFENYITMSVISVWWVSFCVCFYGQLRVMSREIEHQWNQSGCKEMFMHFLVDGLLNHRSTKSSLMQHSQSVAHGDGEELRRERKMCTVVNVASWSNGLWERNSPVTVQLSLPWGVLEIFSQCLN